MEIKIDPIRLREVGESIKKAADYFDLKTDNMQWKLFLPRSQALMVEDEQHDFQRNLLGLDEKTYMHYCAISSLYSNLSSFYDGEAEMIRREQSHGINRVYIPYDPNLTLEEACLKYAKCDKETAVKIYRLVSDAEHKGELHVKEIRENYQGDLATQLGKNAEEYEQRAVAEAEAFAKAAAVLKESEFYKKMEGRYNNVGTTMESYLNAPGQQLPTVEEENTQPKM